MYPGDRSRDGQLLRGREPSPEHLARCRLQLLERRQRTWAWRRFVCRAPGPPWASRGAGGGWTVGGGREKGRLSPGWAVRGALLDLVLCSLTPVFQGPSQR